MADIKTVQLIVNSEQAKSKLDDINKRLVDIRKKRQTALDEGNAAALQTYTKEMKSLERQATKMQTRATTITKTLKNLDKATPNELKATIREVTKELNSGKVVRGSKEWETLNDALRECNNELKKIKEESKAAEGTLKDAEKGIAGFGNKWVGLIGSIQMGWDLLDKVRNIMGEYVSANLDMAEAESQVTKYTGMTSEEVKELNEEFKKMDTRTSREQLNALAGDAGRLGITGKQGVLDFVEAADMINVALGEDLGEDAVKNIGKLAQLFGDDDKMGLKQAMISTGSTINHLGSISSASESYIVDFTGRLSSMAATAKMSQADVMGLAAVLDQGMVQSEQASTALSSIIQKLYKDTSGMASAVGLNVKEFATLLKTDSNEALMTWLDAVNKMGGMDVIAPLLGDLKLSGAGVSKTIATLAGNIDLVRTTQEEANKAFQEGTSILSEVEKANNTPLAQQEKLQKQLHDLKVQLGEELYPTWQAGMGMTSQMVSLLSTLMSFLGQYGKQILVLTGIFVNYRLAVLASTNITKVWAVVTKGAAAVQVVWNKAIALAQIGMIALRHGLASARIAMVAFNTAVKANPLGLIASLLTTIVGGLWIFSDATEEATEKVDELKQIQEEAAASIAQERSRIEQLTGIIRSNTASYDEKKRAIEAIQRIIPGYNAELDKEGRLIKENTKAIEDYIKMLNAKALANAAEKAMTEITNEVMQAEMKRDAKANNVKAVKRELKKAQYQEKIETRTGVYASEKGGNAYSYTTDVNAQRRFDKEAELALQEEALRDAQEKVDAAKAKLDKMNAWLQSNPDVLKIVNSNVIEGDDNRPTYTPTDKNATKTAVQRAKDAAEVARIKAQLELETGVIRQQQYKDRMISIEQSLYDELSRIYPEDTKGRLEAEKARHDAIKKYKQQYTDWSIKDIERQEREERANLEANYAHGTISEKQYRQELERIQTSYLRRKAALAEKEGDTEGAKKYTAEAEAQEYKNMLARREEYEKQAQQMQSEYMKKSIAERREAENTLLTELIAAGVIAKEKEEEFRKAIKDKFDKEEEEENQKKKADKYGNIGGQTDPLTSSIVSAMTAMDNLSQKIRDGKANWSDYAGAAIGALGMVSAMMSSASNYMQACYQAEEAKVTKRYDAEIKAAGANTKRGKQLEEKKQKELAAMKAKYNKKAMAIEIAQAVASTAMAAINAYASAAKVNFILGPIAAAAATAAGMLQIATIKKQHEAQAAGYYEGGFTGGNSYRREAGVVHQGEFVANHRAVNNPNVLPVLKMLDYAQRNNTIASVTSADIAQAAGAPGRQMVVEPVVIHETERTSAALERLNDNLERGIHAAVNITGEDGLERQWHRYNQMKRRA
ncbi:MAG: phage tail tape measure protein [Bacteroidaceae bacterium]|nr:phage tail tape measure protein [Bacteroidaceae bacterium]